MNFFGELGRKLSMLFRRSKFDADLDEEMRLHLELREQQGLQAGLTQIDARSAAYRRFGNPTALKEKSHMTWGWQWFEDLLQDVAYGIRTMLRCPGITIVALLSLALGIGANTAIFSLMDAVMLRSLPVNDPGQLVLFGNGTDSGISDGFSNEDLFSYPFYREMQQKNEVFSDLAAVFSMNNRIHGFVEGRSEAEPMNIQLVSGTYFPMLGVHAMVGRILTNEDDRTKDGNPVAVLVSGGQATVPLDVSIDVRLLLFTLVITCSTAILFGMIPALRATKLELTESLKDGRGTASTGAKNPLAKTLVITQIAFTLVLLVASGLFLRSLINLTNVDTGFNRENVLRLQTDASSIGYTYGDSRLLSLVSADRGTRERGSGVRAASSSLFTYNEGSWNTRVSVHGYDADKNRNVKHNIVTNGYFAAMGIPLLAGRTFASAGHGNLPKGDSDQRNDGAHHVSERFRYRTPVRRRRSGPCCDLQVIGIVKDVKFGSLQENQQTLDYFPVAQQVRYLNDFEVRYSGDFGAIASAVRHAIHEVDRNLPISNVTTLNEQVNRSITNQRLVAQLSTFFGLLAVFLSCIGIYGLMSYVVTRRTNEIGIRMALGAERSDVRWMVMREILLLVAVGIGIGVPIALAGNRLISNMLFGLRPADPVSLIAAVGALLIVAVIAGYLPARRASLVDPMVALRYE